MIINLIHPLLNKRIIDKLIVEVKGREWPGDAAKEKAVKEWVAAVNESGE